MKVYYAHCIAIYNTPQEARDIDTLRQLGFEVYNPNNSEVDATVKRLKAEQNTNYMDIFWELIATQDALAFRALPDGAVPAGVSKEIGMAERMGKPVFELPSALGRRTITLEQTREYLAEVGQR